MFFFSRGGPQLYRFLISLPDPAFLPSGEAGVPVSLDMHFFECCMQTPLCLPMRMQMRVRSRSWLHILQREPCYSSGGRAA